MVHAHFYWRNPEKCVLTSTRVLGIFFRVPGGVWGSLSWALKVRRTRRDEG